MVDGDVFFQFDAKKRFGFYHLWDLVAIAKQVEDLNKVQFPHQSRYHLGLTQKDGENLRGMVDFDEGSYDGFADRVMGYFLIEFYHSDSNSSFVGFDYNHLFPNRIQYKGRNLSNAETDFFVANLKKSGLNRKIENFSVSHYSVSPISKDFNMLMVEKN